MMQFDLAGGTGDVADSHAADREPQPPLLVFIHIPKTAGTAMRLVLLANGPGSIRAPANVFKGVADSIRRRSSGLRTGDGPAGLDEARILDWPPSVRNSRVSAETTFRRFGSSATSRSSASPSIASLSHFFAIRDRAEGCGGAGKVRASPLFPGADPRRHARGRLHHTTPSDADALWGPEPFDEVTDEMLEQAKEKPREGMVFFGLSERFG